MPSRNTETESGGKKSSNFILFQAKGKHSQLEPQQLCPRSLLSYLHEVLAFFFLLLQNFKTAVVGIRQLGNWRWSFMKLAARGLLSEMKTTRECRRRRMSGAEYISDGIRA